MTDQIVYDGVLNINKPIGWSSFDAVRWVKQRLHRAKAGHAGTLDPFAEGILLVCLGPATKSVPYLMSREKEYIGVMQLGIETDTLDITGRIVQRQTSPEYTRETIVRLLQTFEGDIEQTPPRYSALKKDGKRFYQMARDGSELEPAPRRVFIHELEIIDYTHPFLSFRTVCSKGTFIRSLARDVAAGLGTCGFLRRLVRTRVGDYKLDDAVRPGQEGESLQAFVRVLER